jgi:uncharacterized protein YcbX
MAVLASIHVYPLKSCRPLPLPSATVEERGLADDRRWMVIDANDRFLTGRQQPRLTLIAAVPDGDALRLSAPGMPDLRVTAATGGERIATAVWGTAVRPLPAEAAAHEWISRFLGVPCRIVHMDAACTRPVTTAYDSDRETVAEVSLADGFPLLLISQAALDALNERLAAPVPILRFRPNLVVAGTQAHAEDGWKRIRVGAVEFDVVKPCTRCVFTTVDFEHGAFDPGGEPLRTLTRYRRSPDGVTFGQNLIPRGTGPIRRGDPVEVLA